MFTAGFMFAFGLMSFFFMAAFLTVLLASFIGKVRRW